MESDENSDNKYNYYKSLFRPLTQENIYSYYIPISGSISYYAFSIHIYTPFVFRRMFSSYHLPIVNSFLFNSHIGAGLFLYTRTHIKKAPVYNRVMYSVCGSILFNFGSILFWAATKAILPQKSFIRFIFAFTSSLAIMSIGRDYLQYVDKLV